MHKDNDDRMAYSYDEMLEASDMTRFMGTPDLRGDIRERFSDIAKIGRELEISLPSDRDDLAVAWVRVNHYYSMLRDIANQLDNRNCH